MYIVTLWCVRVTIVAVQTQQCVFCVTELHVTVSCVKQQCFCGKFMSSETIKLIHVICCIETNKCHLFVAVFRHAARVNRS